MQNPIMPEDRFLASAFPMHHNTRNLERTTAAFHGSGGKSTARIETMPAIQEKGEQY
jgi:hypothetical protein